MPNKESKVIGSMIKQIDENAEKNSLQSCSEIAEERRYSRFICTLTLDIMQLPVALTEQGVSSSLEGSFLTTWCSSHSTNPVTSAELSQDATAGINLQLQQEIKSFLGNLASERDINLIINN